MATINDKIPEHLTDEALDRKISEIVARSIAADPDSAFPEETEDLLMLVHRRNEELRRLGLLDPFEPEWQPTDAGVADPAGDPAGDGDDDGRKP